MSTILCPTCQNDPNKIVVMALVKRDGECVMENHVCPTCTGIGSITREQYEGMAIGEALRRARMERNLTVQQVAIIANVTPLQISGFERGWRDHPNTEDRNRIVDALERIRREIPTRA